MRWTKWGDCCIFGISILDNYNKILISQNVRERVLQASLPAQTYSFLRPLKMWLPVPSLKLPWERVDYATCRGSRAYPKPKATKHALDFRVGKMFPTE